MPSVLDISHTAHKPLPFCSILCCVGYFHLYSYAITISNFYHTKCVHFRSNFVSKCFSSGLQGKRCDNAGPTMDPSLNYVYLRSNNSAEAFGNSSSSDLTSSRRTRRRIRSRRRTSSHRDFETRGRDSVDSLEHQPGPSDRPQDPNHNTYLYILRNADPSLSTDYNMSGATLDHGSYEAVGRRNHIMASSGALLFPPAASLLCVILVILYVAKDSLGITEETVAASWKMVWEEKQFWRLVIAQFFHFGKLYLLVNVFTLFTVGRYLERKVTPWAFVGVIMIMSVLANVIFIFICEYRFVCSTSKSCHTSGFGNVLYSLRVLLAYAMEPRNYEKDLVFGLYPMVVSASHASWQPVLDLIVFKLVLPELCLAGQLSGILAGFAVTFLILLWPTRGIYIASPPFYWTMMGSPDPSRRRDSEDDEEHDWQKRTYSNSDFWLPVSGRGFTLDSQPSSSTSTNIEVEQLQNNPLGRLIPPGKIISHNSLERRSIELKGKLSRFFGIQQRNSIMSEPKLGPKSAVKKEEPPPVETTSESTLLLRKKLAEVGSRYAARCKLLREQLKRNRRSKHDNKGLGRQPDYPESEASSKKYPEIKKNTVQVDQGQLDVGNYMINEQEQSVAI